MAQQAEPTPEHELAGSGLPDGTIPGAATADRGKDGSENALPAGAEFLSADVEVLRLTQRRTAGACEGELT